MNRLAQIQELQAQMAKMPQEELPVKHHFGPGVYIREIFMPSGSAVIGKIHATEHFNIIIKGSCRVATVDGIEEHLAGDTFISKAGIQKLVYMHEDVIWQTVHVTDKTDVDDIEKDIIAESYDMLPHDVQLRLGVAS